jgi:hypothetical protein
MEIKTSLAALQNEIEQLMFKNTTKFCLSVLWHVMWMPALALWHL